jgi:hypothetical protein
MKGNVKMTDSHHIKHSGKARSLVQRVRSWMKWVWTIEFGGTLVGVVGFIIAIAGAGLAVLASKFAKSTDVFILKCVAESLVIFCLLFIGAGFLLIAYGFIITASSVVKQIACFFGSSTTKKD